MRASDYEIKNLDKLDRILVKLCRMIIDGKKRDSEFFGTVAAAVLDNNNNIVARLNYASPHKGRRVHAERAAMEAYQQEHGEIPEGSIIITTCSPCSEHMQERDGPSCTDLVNHSTVHKVYCGYRDSTQDQDQRTFTLQETGNPQIRELCKMFASTFINHDELEESHNKSSDRVLFLGTDAAIVGQEHSKRLQLSDQDAKRVQAIAERHGAWYEGNGMDRKLTAGIIDDYAGSWDDDLLSPAIKGYPAPFLYVLFSNIKENDTVEGKIGSDPDSTIFDRILSTQPSTNYFPDREFDAETLQKFLQSVSEGPYDFVRMSQAPATESNVRRFFTQGEQLMFPNNWTDYPYRAGRVAKLVNDLRDRFLASRKQGVYVAGSDHLQAVQQFLNQSDDLVVTEDKDKNKSQQCARTKSAKCQCESVKKITETQETVSAICALEHSDKVKGTILFEQQSGYPTLIVGQITGLAPGAHGFHIHEFGDLSDGCESAGKHYNPDRMDHGDIDGGHVGDLGNITADKNGQANFRIVARRVSLSGDRSVVGRAIVIHENQDDLGRGGDQESLKTGNAGDRLACGVITLRNSLQENFADGKIKGKSRPGRVKRAGASCSGSVTELRKRAKNASGERAKMYHWCANMKSGRKK